MNKNCSSIILSFITNYHLAFLFCWDQGWIDINMQWSFFLGLLISSCCEQTYASSMLYFTFIYLLNYTFNSFPIRIYIYILHFILSFSWLYHTDTDLLTNFKRLIHPTYKKEVEKQWRLVVYSLKESSIVRRVLFFCLLCKGTVIINYDLIIFFFLLDEYIDIYIDI